MTSLPSARPGVKRPPAGGLVLGPARREELVEIVGSYLAQWVIAGPYAGGQWFAFPRRVMVQAQLNALTLARLQREHRPHGDHATGWRSLPRSRSSAPAPPDKQCATTTSRTPPPLALPTPPSDRPQCRLPAASTNPKETG